MKGVEAVLDFVEVEKISKCDALELIEQIVAIRDFPITMMKKGDYLVSDLTALTIIMGAREHLRIATELEKDDSLPKFSVCEGCGKHGRITGKEFQTVDVFCKADAKEIVEDAFGKGMLTKPERQKVLEDINSSELPETLPEEVDPSLN